MHQDAHQLAPITAKPSPGTDASLLLVAPRASRYRQLPQLHSVALRQDQRRPPTWPGAIAVSWRWQHLRHVRCAGALGADDVVHRRTRYVVQIDRLVARATLRADERGLK